MIRPSLLLCSAALCLYGSVASAQIINVLPQTSKAADDGFGGNLGASFSWRKGNTNLLDSSLTLSAAWRDGDNVLYAIGKARYGSRSDELFIQQTFAHLRFRRQILDWLELETFGQHEHDRFRRIDLRALVGGGPRVSAEPFETLELDVELDVELNLGAAYMFEYERYSAGEGEPEAANHRVSCYARVHWKVDDRLALHHTSFLQPRLDTLDDYRILSESAATVKANDWFSIKVSYNFTYDSVPPAAVESLDQGLETTLAVSW